MYGLVVYGANGYWDAAWPLAYVHPLAMLGAVATAGMATARAARAPNPTAAWGQIVRFHGISALLVVLGVGAALSA